MPSAELQPVIDELSQIRNDIKQIKDLQEKRHSSDMSNAKLAAIVESSDDAILSKDLNGIIQTWNAGAQRIFGYTSAEAVGHSITMLIPPERMHEEPRILARLRTGE